MNFHKNGVSTFVVGVVVAVLATAVTYLLIKRGNAQPGTVVILNGTSSSGKTTIMTELKKMYGNGYEFVDLDSFERSYSAFQELQKQSESPTLDPKAKEQLVLGYMNKLVDDFYGFAKEKVLKGATVFVDTVPILIDAEKEEKQMGQVLKGIKRVNVLLYCPLEVLVARVEQRNAAGKPEEKRYTLQAAAQYQQLYKAQGSALEQVLDRVSSKLMKDIRRAAIKAFMDAAPPNTTKEEIAKVAQDRENDYKEYVKQFKLDELEEVAVVAKVPFDLVLSCKHTPAELAQEIMKFLKR